MYIKLGLPQAAQLNIFFKRNWQCWVSLMDLFLRHTAEWKGREQKLKTRRDSNPRLLDQKSAIHHCAIASAPGFVGNNGKTKIFGPMVKLNILFAFPSHIRQSLWRLQYNWIAFISSTFHGPWTWTHITENAECQIFSTLNFRLYVILGEQHILPYVENSSARYYKGTSLWLIVSMQEEVQNSMFILW